MVEDLVVGECKSVDSGELTLEFCKLLFLQAKEEDEIRFGTMLQYSQLVSSSDPDAVPAMEDENEDSMEELQAIRERAFQLAVEVCGAEKGSEIMPIFDALLILKPFEKKLHLLLQDKRQEFHLQILQILSKNQSSSEEQAICIHQLFAQWIKNAPSVSLSFAARRVIGAFLWNLLHENQAFLQLFHQTKAFWKEQFFI